MPLNRTVPDAGSIPTLAPAPASRGDTPRIRIRADEGGALIDLHELARYRDLLVTLAGRDLRVRYKQTMLGIAWVVLQPVVTSLIFSFVFGIVAGLSSDGRPYFLFAFTGMVAWTAFSSIITRVSHSLVGSAHILSKIYFPRLILPLANVATSLVDFCVSMILLVLMLACYGIWPGWHVLFLPVWLAILLALALGIGLFAASLMVRYRDVGYVLPVALQMGLFISPVAWSTALVPDRYRWILRVNPLSGVLDGFRWSLLGEGTPSMSAIAYSTAMAVAVLWVGAATFKQQERSLADVI
jgi:lipopolysaccharide transport system permease protein